METILEYNSKVPSTEEALVIAEVAKTYHLYDFISTIICERNNYNLNEIKEYIEGTTRPKSYIGIKDIETAVQLITTAMANNEKIRIVGDYDVDGVTSTYVLLTVFETLSYPHISHYLPVREKDGYGLNPDIVERAQIGRAHV